LKFNHLIDKEVRGLLKVNSIISLVMLLLLAKLFSHSSTFPMCPFFSVIPIVPKSFSIVLYLILVIACSMSIFISNKFITLGIVLILFVLGLIDANNIHPFMLCYWTIFIIILLYQFSYIDNNLTLNLIRWLIIGIYFASSIQKMNPYFSEGTYEWLVAPFQKIFSKNIFLFLKNCDEFIPVWELLITIFLVFKKTRKLGTYMAILMHLLIVFILSPIIRPNFYSVHPFNISLIILDILLFKDYKGNIFKDTFQTTKKLLVYIVLIFSMLMPLAHTLGYGHDYLTYDLYSGRYKYSYFIFNQNFKKNLPQNIIKHTFYTGYKDYYMFYLDGWLYYETFGSLYRENFVLQYYKNYMKKYSDENTKCIFIIQRKGTHEYYPL